MTDRYDSILEENANLKRALASSKSIIERSSNDYETLRQIHEEYKVQQERLSKDNDELNLRNLALVSDKKELENQFDQTIRNLKIAIEQKQREIEDIQQKVIPTFDHDMIRIKIINELELPHRQQLEQKQDEIDKLNEQVYELRRQVDIINAKMDIVQKEYDRDIKNIKDKHLHETQALLGENTNLHTRLSSPTQKNNLRNLRKDYESAVQKAQILTQENQEIRIYRIREEKNENLQKYSKQLEFERNEKRTYKSECEKLQVRSRWIEDENIKNRQKIENLMSEIEGLMREKDLMSEEGRKKDDMVHQLQRRIQEVEEENLGSEQKAHEHSMKVYNDEHDKFLEERNKNLGISREFEQLKKQYAEVSEDNKVLRNKISVEMSQLRSENMQMQDENNKLKRQLSSVSKENETIEQYQEKREQHINELERELDGVRKKYRESLQKCQTLENQIDDQQLRGTKSSNNALNDDQSIKIQQKNEKLKKKLEFANSKIIELLQKKMQQSQPNQMQNNLPGSMGQNLGIKGLTKEDEDILKQVTGYQM